MSPYIREIQRQLVEVYNLPENPDAPGVPAYVPDGDYPMTIDGRVDHVKISDGTINCCNFEA